MTFWEYQRPDEHEPDEQAISTALFDLHGALRSYPGPLPTYMDERSGALELPVYPEPVRDLPMARNTVGAVELVDGRARHPEGFPAGRES